jgi:dTDP-L-rhamnose 4-epimerase
MSVPLTILRLQNVYGPGQSPNNSYTGVLTHFARQALLGEQLEVYEGGEILRDFVHVSDVVAAILSSLVEAVPGRRTLDIGSGLPITLFEAAQRISALAGSPAPRITSNFRLGDVRAASADIREAKETIGYKPKVKFEEGIVTVLNWIRGQM